MAQPRSSKIIVWFLGYEKRNLLTKCCKQKYQTLLNNRNLCQCNNYYNWIICMAFISVN